MAGFLAGLVGGVFLRALVVEHVAQRGRQVQRALLAVEDRGEAAQQRLIDELGADRRIGQAARDVFGLQRDIHVFVDQRLVHHVPRLVEVDVFLVERIPEVVVGGADDLVEGVGALTVAIEIEHGLEVVRRHGVVHGVLGDVTVGHARLSHMSLFAVSVRRSDRAVNEIDGGVIFRRVKPFREEQAGLGLVA